MKKFFIQFLLLCLIIFGAMYLAFNPNFLGTNFNLPLDNSSTPGVEQTQLKVGEALVEIEVADSASERNQGLSGRDSLSENAGMLFVFPAEKKYQLWMKGMNFNLDMLFIKDGVVVDVLTDVPAPTEGVKDSELPIYEPVGVVDMLLEVNAGFAAKFGIKVGDMVQLVE